MKRILSSILCVILFVLCFAGCGKNDKLKDVSMDTSSKVTVSDKFSVDTFDKRYDMALKELGSEDVLSVVYSSKDYAVALANDLYSMYGQDKLQALPDYDEYMIKASKSVVELCSYTNKQVMVRFNDDNTYEFDEQNGKDSEAASLAAMIPSNEIKVKLKDAIHTVLNHLQNKDDIWYIKGELAMDKMWNINVGIPGEASSEIEWIANKVVDISTGEMIDAKGRYDESSTSE